jgi:phosphatidylserine/phosphatidylglycerophosphate/cardiolipin synthase-like enzyme
MKLGVIVAIIAGAAIAGYAVPKNASPAPGASAGPVPAATEDGLSVFFSPNGGCADAVIAVIESAKKTLDVQAYYLTSTSIVKAIGQAQERGIKVRVVMDEKAAGEKFSAATYLSDHSVPVWLDGEHPIAHNKVMLVDGQMIITGSFNFTKSADAEHAENLLVIQNKPKLAAAYVANFEAHLKHAKKYVRPKN